MRVLIILLIIIVFSGCTAVKPVRSASQIEKISVGDLIAVNTIDGQHKRLKVNRINNTEVEGRNLLIGEENIVIRREDIKELYQMKEQFHCDFLCNMIIGAGIWALIL